MHCTVRWGGPSGMSFHAETGSGHLVSMDGAPEGGGRNLAPRPMEMVLLGRGHALLMTLCSFSGKVSKTLGIAK